MKLYTIIGGVNGAGKSSLTGAISPIAADTGVIIDVDRLAAERRISDIEAGKLAIAIMEDCLKRGISFTQETTLSGGRTLRTVRRAREAGYRIRLYYVAVSSAGECRKRIENRVEKGGHGIPPQVVERRFAGRCEALLSVLPYCHEAVLYDNENGFTAVAEYRNGEIVTLGDYRPPWLAELLERRHI